MEKTSLINCGEECQQRDDNKQQYSEQNVALSYIENNDSFKQQMIYVQTNVN